jgi:flagellin
MRVNQNITAFNAYRNLSAANASTSKSMEKLSSGTRINRAADDAAGLVISQGLRAQVGGLRQATRNAQDGISVVQTAEGALNEVHNMLGRMRDLAVQASNSGSNDVDAQKAAQAELSALRTEISEISDQTKFGGMSLLDGTYGVKSASVTGYDSNNAITWTAGDDFAININGTGAVTVDLAGTGGTGDQAAAAIQTGIRAALASGSAAQQAFANQVTVTATAAGAGTTLKIDVAGLAGGQTFTLADGTGTPLAAMGVGAVTAASGTGGVFQVGAKGGETISVAIGDMDATALGLGAVNLDTSSGGNATTAIAAIDTAIKTVSTTRGTLGATQNRFESRISNLNVATENLSASESRIRDTDYAMEMVSFTRGQIMNQVGTSMLGQANSLPQGVLSLLRG